MNTASRLPEKDPENHGFSTSKKFLFATVIFIGFFVLAEILLITINIPGSRSTGNADQEHWFKLGFQQDTTLPWSWIPIPGARGNIANVSYRFNASGFRGIEEVIEARPEDLLRIFCMGDSCTMGWEVGDGETFCRQLQRLLQESLSHPVETINAGVPGYTSFQGLHQLKTRILPLEPDVIVISYNWNDHTFAIHMHETLETFMQDNFFGLPDEDLPRNSVYSGIQSTVARLRSYQLIDNVLGRFRPEEGVMQSWNKPLDPDQVPVRVALQDYRANLQKMIDLARSSDIIPILMTQPSQPIRSTHAFEELAESLRYSAASGEDWARFETAMKNRFERAQQDYNEIIREVAEANGVTLVDMVPIFGPRKNSNVLLDPVHPTPEGHLLIAHELRNAILEALNDGR